MRTIYFHGNRKKNQIALTFDDGPCKKTNKILDILKKEKVPATFFVCGKKIRGNEKILRRMIKQGCEVGNHTYNHVLTIFKSQIRITEEINKTDIELAKLKIKTNLFRPPYFWFGLNTYLTCKNIGKSIIEADSISEDWKSKGTDYCIKKVLKKTKKGSIINLHDYLEDIGKNKFIEEITKKTIKELKSRGYKFATISELIK